MKSNIRVSVVCTAYNHEKYIKDALEGFVNQKTNFEYEVIVHDDASTDNTAKIIKEYEEKYPKLIKAIYQKENQYSKKISITKNIVFPLIKGDYMALCEGDDYWTDCNKLQRQVDFLDNNSSFSAVVHNSYFYDMKNNTQFIKYRQDKNVKLEFKNILIDGGYCFHTSSLVFRKEYYNYPDSFKIERIGDYPLSVYLSIVGDIYYFKDCMSVRRYNVVDSWTEKNISIEKQCEVIDKRNAFLDAVDEYTNHKEHEYIVNLQKKNTIHKLSMQNNYIEITKYYNDIISKYSLREKLSLYKNALVQLLRKR